MAILYDFWQKHVSKTSKTFYYILDKHYPLDEKKKVLDFGCGTGLYAKIFNPNNYLGLEIDKKRIKIAKKSFPNHKFIYFEPNKKIRLNNNSFDQILIMGVMHHLPDPALNFYIKEFTRILKKGGIIFTIEPTLTRTSPLANKIMRFVDRGKHIRYEEGYKNLFKKDFILKKKYAFISESLYNQVIYIFKKK